MRSLLQITRVCVIGLRGAVSFALSLHLELESHETRQIIVTTTLIIVIFTILILGGSTMPLMKVTIILDCRTCQTNLKLENVSITKPQQYLQNAFTPPPLLCWKGRGRKGRGEGEGRKRRGEEQRSPRKLLFSFLHQIFNFCGSCTNPHPNLGQIWHVSVGSWYNLSCQI